MFGRREKKSSEGGGGVCFAVRVLRGWDFAARGEYLCGQVIYDSLHG